MARTSDAAVIAESLERPAAFAVIYDRHGATLLRYLARRTETDVAESLLGELFRSAFEQREHFDRSRESARPWLYGIASNLLQKHRRSEARRLAATARLAIEEAPAQRDDLAAADALDLRALLPQLLEALEQLPDDEREALLLFAWEDLSYDAIAEVQQIPLGTVRSRIHRARRRIRERIVAIGKEPFERQTSSGRATT